MRTSVIVAAALLGGCGTDGFFEVISPVAPGGSADGCDGAATRSVDTVDVGVLEEAVPGMPMFRVLADGDPVDVVLGSQGADMVVLVLQTTGVPDGACLAQRTEILDEAGDRISYNLLPKTFTLQPDGTARTKQIFFPGNYVDGPATIEVAIGSRSLNRTVDVMR